jgi:electron transfer flavoprotein alpha subunit
MSETILFLATTNANGQLEKSALESLQAAIQLKTQLSASLVIGLIGSTSAASAQVGAACASACYAVSGEAFSQPRYATDVAAAQVLAQRASATIIIAPATSRIQRFLPGLAQRLNGRIDTHVTGLTAEGDQLRVTRWYYRQRMEAKIARTVRPWLISVEAGCFEAKDVSGAASFEAVSVEGISRSTVLGIENSAGGDQTIRPDAKLLFVAGAGWTKKQQDGQPHIKEAEQHILGFVEVAKASLGSSKSMVDLSAEGQDVLKCLTHLHQIGQTGATPRHQKGLSTCCHGEEPHAVGWRFVQERRAINLDPNCGWAHGKADVLYVANAFEVMEKVNALLKA